MCVPIALCVLRRNYARVGATTALQPVKTDGKQSPNGGHMLQYVLEYDTEKGGDQVTRVRHFRYEVEAREFTVTHDRQLFAWRLYSVVTGRNGDTLSETLLATNGGN